MKTIEMIEVSQIRYQTASREARDQWDILDQNDIAKELWVNDVATQWIYWAVGETFEVSDGRMFHIVDDEFTAQALLFHFWSTSSVESIGSLIKWQAKARLTQNES